jgi:hypothetical protein
MKKYIALFILLIAAAVYAIPPSPPYSLPSSITANTTGNAATVTGLNVTANKTLTVTENATISGNLGTAAYLNVNSITAAQLAAVKWNEDFGVIYAGMGTAIESNSTNTDVYRKIGHNATITGWHLVCSTGAANAEIDVLVGANIASLASITGGNAPNIKSNQDAVGSNSGWTSAISANSIIKYHVVSADCVGVLTLTLTAERGF